MKPAATAHGARGHSDERIAHNSRTIVAEGCARKALEEHVGKPFSDDEWRLYRSRLIDFARLLREWETTR